MLVSTAHKAFGLETDFGGFFLFEQRQSKAPQGGEVLIRLPLPDAAVILTKHDAKTQCRQFSIPQCLRTAVLSCRASSPGRLLR